MFFQQSVDAFRFADAAGGKMEIKHVCCDCGAVLAVHQHGSYQEVKTCLAGMRPLCDACHSWPGCQLPSQGTRGREGSNAQHHN